MSTLQQQIKARIAEAERKGIAGKAKRVVQIGDSSETCESYSDDLFLITYKSGYEQCVDGAPILKVKIVYQGKTVFEENERSILSYIPGDDWESALDRLVKRRERANKKTQKTVAVERKKRQTQADAEERKKWGL